MLHGLSAEEAARRLAEHGANTPPQPPRRSPASRVLDQLRDPMVMLLLGALVVTLALRDVPDTVIIAVVVMVNTAIGVVQETRAEQAIDALSTMAAPHATVLRDGTFLAVPSADVVPDDLLRLEAGDVVAADAELVEAHAVQVDESAMTGESVPVDRGVGDEVLAGTVVTHGRATALVTRTGADSGLGRIAALIAGSPRRPTPLQQRLTRLSHLLVTVVIAVALVVLVLGLLRGQSLAEMLLLAVSLAVAAIPESLPAVVSVALALGAYRMARRSAVVRWLPAVETLGSVTVLASDKTGTLTEGRMFVQRAWTPAGEYDVSGHGYGVAGELVPRTDPRPAGTPERLLRDLLLCTDARLGGPVDDEWTVVGDPMEASLLVLAAKGGVLREPVRRTWTREAELPFDSARQRMTTLDRADGGGWLVVCKGAPETVLGLAEGPVDAARAAAAGLAEQGFRVMAVADAQPSSRPEDAQLERGLRVVGLVGVLDPPRPDASEVVAQCQAAGMRLVMVTGDHPRTARAVAHRLGITRAAPDVADGPAVLRGEHVERLDSIGVYARTKPEQKVDIVQALQDHGEVVAMTGDGVNDAPALRRADIGVAMGDRGTEVARQAADLVLADDDLKTVVVAVAEGRRIFTNIRMFLRYALSGGLAEIIVILLGPFVGIPLPLLPAQILWINMLTHGLPGVAFGGEPLDPDVMHRPSASPQRSVLGEGLWGQVLWTGALISVVSLAAGVLAPGGPDHERSWIFLILGLAQLGVAVALRAPRRGVGWRGRGLELSVLGAALLQVAGVTVPFLRELLGTQPIELSDGPLLLLLALVPAVVVAVGRRLRLRAGSPSGPAEGDGQRVGVQHDQ